MVVYCIYASHRQEKRGKKEMKTQKVMTTFYVKHSTGEKYKNNK
jgi:hypothetical protein